MKVTNESEKAEPFTTPEKFESNSEVSKISDDAIVINYIMLGRIYDLLAIIADGLGKGEDVINIMDLHKKGQLMSPPPIIVSDNEQA